MHARSLLPIALAASTLLAGAAIAQSQGAVPLPASAAKPKPAAKPDDKKETQPATTPDAKAPAAPAAAPKGVTTEFEPAPLSLEEANITLLIPKGAKSEAQHGAGAAEIQIIPEDKSWIIRIYTRQFADRSMTTSELMKAQIELVEASVSQEGSKASTIEHNKIAMVAGRPAERVYLQVPSKDGKSEIVRGITVFKSQPGSFVFCDVLCDKSRFESARVAYEDTQTTLSVVDQAESQERVATLVKSGTQLLTSLSEADLKEIVSRPERWERLYVPAKDGDPEKAREVGYRRIQTGFGKRSQFAQFGSGADDAPGFFVQIDSRLRVGENYADMQGIFFMTVDRKEELWTLSTALKTPEKTHVARELGARKDEAMTVTTTDGNSLANSKPVHTTIPPEGYISRVEHYLLPQILVKQKVLSEFGFYSYQHEDKQIRMRRDALTQADKNGKVFELTTSLRSMGGEKTLVQTTRIRDTGELIETRLADGSVWEPTNIKTLLELWRAKGLPVK
jgi:hypothetical protein